MPLLETFEASPLRLAWSGAWNWTQARAHSGVWAFKSDTIGHNETATLTVTLPPRAATIQFWYFVSSEPTYDKLEFLINGTVRMTASGEVGWTQSQVFDVTGVTQVQFRYSKDSSGSSGDDAAYIDDIAITFQPLTAVSNTFDGGTAGSNLTAANSGGSSGIPFNNFVGTTKYSTTKVRGETGLSVVAATPGTDTHIDWIGVEPAADVLCARMYLYLDAPLATAAPLMALLGPNGLTAKTWIFPDGHVAVYAGNTSPLVLASTAGMTPVGQWVRLEWRFTISPSGSGTTEIWSYLDAESPTHDGYFISETVTWPGGKPYTMETHLRGDTAGTGGLYVDEVAVAAAKLGPAPSSATVRPRTSMGGTAAAHRAASW
ncbi:hypothetical protein ABZ470_26395 [Streptosporangium sp. NPDC020072]|uniref:hypothetical protein n=1 Tax=Streptosporangium sp. NPDC020072 TaxID=3154788 RepID=UPI003421A822